LYDKISRDDILAHAYAQCRSNRGAPGIDGQGFAEIDAYGVERWLTELALALRQETYRPERATPAVNPTVTTAIVRGQAFASRDGLRSVLLIYLGAESARICQASCPVFGR
jgi:hypothetical protein